MRKPAKPRSASARRRRVAEREIVGLIRNPDGLAVRHLIDVDAVREEEAAVKELHLERQIFAAPQRAFGIEADGSILVVIELCQFVGQLVVRRLERLGCGFSRNLPDRRRVERRRRGHRGPHQASGQERQNGRCDGRQKKLSAIQGGTPALMSREQTSQRRVSSMLFGFRSICATEERSQRLTRSCDRSHAPLRTVDRPVRHYRARCSRDRRSDKTSRRN